MNSLEFWAGFSAGATTVVILFGLWLCKMFRADEKRRKRKRLTKG